MGTKSKLFRVFVEGETISDGRKISAEMIDECVANHNLATYTPRINIEHIAGYSPEPPFNGYGDVIALSASTDDFVIGGKTEKRRALYAQVDANDQLVKLSKADQKPFPSVELTPSYAGTGKFGVIGLAFTDTPASIGTERLKFSHRAPGSVFASATDAVEIQFEAAPAQTDGSAGVFAAMTAFYNKLTSGTPTTPAAPPAPVTPPVATTPAPANDNFAQIHEGLGLMAASITALATKIDTDVGAVRAEFGTIKTRLESTEQPGFSRTPAPGGSTAIVTDC